MTVADRTEGYQARCLPHLLMLRMLASDDAEAPSPWLAMAKVAQATDAILAGAGDFTQLRRHLRRFEALTSAIWIVQDPR